MAVLRENPLSAAFANVRGAFVFVGLFSLFINLTMLVAPIYMLQVYDRVLASRSYETLLSLSVLAAALILLSAVVEIARARVLVRIGTELDAVLAGQLFKNAFRADPSATAPGDEAGASQSMRDLETVRSFMTGAGVLALFDAPWTPIYLAIIFLFHPLLGAIACVGALLILTLAILSEYAVRSVLARAGMASRYSNGLLDGLQRGADAVQVMGMLPNLLRGWGVYHEAGVAWQAAASDRMAIIHALAKAVRMGLQIAILGAGAWLVLENQVTAGVMVAASIIMGRALSPIEASISQWRSFVSARQARQRLATALNSKQTPAERMRLPAPDGRPGGTSGWLTSAGR
jgi:ABC-type protease/lipase transport system fused ATPase/permease subunit